MVGGEVILGKNVLVLVVDLFPAISEESYLLVAEIARRIECENQL